MEQVLYSFAQATRGESRMRIILSTCYLIGNPYGTASLGTNKPECSYTYAFGLNSMSPFSPATVRLLSTTVRNMPVNCKENTHALAADMNGEYDTGNCPPITQFNFRYFLSGTGNKNHGRSGVNVLKIDGHV